MTKKYEKFEEWMVGKTVLWDDQSGVVVEEYHGKSDSVWVEWQDGDTLWIDVNSLVFLNVSEQQDAVDQTVPSEHTPIPWEVGQIVYCLIRGKGQVNAVGQDSVVVWFDKVGAWKYTYKGELLGPEGVRTLFFSKPTIIADTMPPKKPFVPKLKEGEKILLKAPYLEEEKVAFVRREEENILYYMLEDGTKDYSGKSQITVTRIGEEIKWEN